MSDDRFIDDFLRDHTEELDALRTAVGKPLDLSYESLDSVEDYYRGVLDKSSELGALETVNGRIARYLGATLAKHTRGKWTQHTETKRPSPAIAVPGIAKRTFKPLGVVLDYRRLRYPGWLRDQTEHWDLPLRRSVLAELRAQAKDTPARIITDVAEATGQRIARLDDSAKTMGLVEKALNLLAHPDVGHARRREFRHRVIWWLGSLYSAALGKGNWSVEADPQQANFGELEIARWAPARVVAAVETRPKTGALRNALTEAINEANA